MFSSVETMQRRSPYLIAAASAGVWCFLIVAPPVFAHLGLSPAMLYEFFHRVCHQLDERSLHTAGHPLAVCARCTGIYVGFLAGAIALVLRLTVARNTPRWLLVVGLLPIVVNVVVGPGDTDAPGLLVRCVTGFIAGGTLSLFTIPYFAEAVSGWLSHTTIILNQQKDKHHERTS